MTASTTTGIALPAWACVSEKRRLHIERVTALLDSWAARLALSEEEAQTWHDAGRLHDALRDAAEPLLRELAGDSPDYSLEMLHGPAAAEQLRRDGEKRSDLLDAIRFHTIGSVTWGRVGRALYMADYLDPGRGFARADRAYLAAQVPTAFDGTFRQVVRARLEWALREGMRLYPAAVALWNDVR
jgi:2-amino-4-hydroxy-6-hydroxymethyldihydropteridine diphosphokinase